MKKLAYIVIGVSVFLILLVSIGVAMDDPEPAATPTGADKPAAQDQEPDQGASEPADSEDVTVTATPATFDPIRFSGVGDKKTAPFTVPAEEFIIEWEWEAEDPEYGGMAFFLYPRGEEALYLEMIDCDSPEGSTYSYSGPGEMYLNVLAANLDRWEITVKPAT